MPSKFLSPQSVYYGKSAILLGSGAGTHDMVIAGRTSDIKRARERLAGVVGAILLSQGLNQAGAAALLGIDQPTVSRLAGGRAERFSLERLFRFLNTLDRDVEIRIRPKPRHRPRGRTRVV